MSATFTLSVTMESGSAGVVLNAPTGPEFAVTSPSGAHAHYALVEGVPAEKSVCCCLDLFGFVWPRVEDLA